MELSLNFTVPGKSQKISPDYTLVDYY